MVLLKFWYNTYFTLYYLWKLWTSLPEKYCHWHVIKVSFAFSTIVHNIIVSDVIIVIVNLLLMLFNNN